MTTEAGVSHWCLTNEDSSLVILCGRSPATERPFAKGLRLAGSASHAATSGDDRAAFGG